MPGKSFTHLTYQGTQDLHRALQILVKHIPACLGPEDNFRLKELCKFETFRYLFFADHEFTMGLDETDYRQVTGEIETFTENAEKAHASIFPYLNCYS